MLLETTTNQVFLPDAPAIAGLTFRHIRDDSDFVTMAALITACNDADQVGEIITAEDLRLRSTPTALFDPRHDMLLAEIDAELIGLVRAWERHLDNGQWLFGHVGFVRPDWRRHGLGHALLYHAEARARERLAASGHRGPAFYQSGAADTEVATHALLIGAGYEIMRNFFEMVRPDLENIPDLPLPDGLEVRPATPDHYRAIGAALNEAFRDHWAHSEATEEEHQRWLNSPHFQPHLWQVAWAGDEAAGMVLPYIDADENAHFNRLRGWPDPICVRRPWRKQGLASALIARSLRTLKEHGMTEAGLGVDTENLSGALRVYERLGFRAVKRFSSYWKSMDNHDESHRDASL